MKSCWMQFVKDNENSVSHISQRKERFEMLSNLWKDRKSKLVTLHVDYINDLIKSRNVLQEELQSARSEIKFLYCLVDALESR